MINFQLFHQIFVNQLSALFYFNHKSTGLIKKTAEKEFLSTYLLGDAFLCPKVSNFQGFWGPNFSSDLVGG